PPPSEQRDACLAWHLRVALCRAKRLQRNERPGSTCRCCFVMLSEVEASPNFMDSLVQLSGIQKNFGDAKALQPTNLTVERGKTTVLIGPSGCGKSTLLRIIIRLIEHDAGTVGFNGAPITPNNIDRLRRRIGYVIQEGGLFPHLTARANVLLMARHLGKAAPEMRERLSELCELTRLSENLLARYPVELSGGQRQRVSLMRALMLSPELLLLDEPLGALDPLVRASLQKDLKEIFARL